MLIKICGITNGRDAEASVRYGANALGFIRFPRSPRHVDYDTIEEISKRIPAGIARVGVFVKGWMKDVREELFDIIQLHGFADERELPSLQKKILVAVGPAQLDRFPRHDLIVDQSRGSGRKADWSALRNVKRDFVLSGGLDPTNIREALELLRPAGVDASTGVESGPGIKDPVKLRDFLVAVSRFVEEKGSE
jgi:phosphoribosylanthranilate isomerase